MGYDVTTLGLLVLIVLLIMCIPLLPAYVLYKALSPKTSPRGKTEGSSASGQVSGNVVSIGKFRFQFSLLGATATYVLLLFAAIAVLVFLEGRVAQREAHANRIPWRVKLPIEFLGSEGNLLPSESVEPGQLMVELTPPIATPMGNSVVFWVLAESGDLPSATIFTPATNRFRIDLNDFSMVRHDEGSREVVGVTPIRLTLQPRPYSGHLSGR